MVQGGIFVFSLVKDAIKEVGLTSEFRDALTWAIVVVRDGKYFLVAGLEFCHSHGSILAEKWALRGALRHGCPYRDRQVPSTASGNSHQWSISVKAISPTVQPFEYLAELQRHSAAVLAPPAEAGRFMLYLQQSRRM